MIDNLDNKLTYQNLQHKKFISCQRMGSCQFKTCKCHCSQYRVSCQCCVPQSDLNNPLNQERNKEIQQDMVLFFILINDQRKNRFAQSQRVDRSPGNSKDSSETVKHTKSTTMAGKQTSRISSEKKSSEDKRQSPERSEGKDYLQSQHCNVRTETEEYWAPVRIKLKKKIINITGFNQYFHQDSQSSSDVIFEIFAANKQSSDENKQEYFQQDLFKQESVQGKKDISISRFGFRDSLQNQPFQQQSNQQNEQFIQPLQLQKTQLNEKLQQQYEEFQQFQQKVKQQQQHQLKQVNVDEQSGILERRLLQTQIPLQQQQFQQSQPRLHQSQGSSTEGKEQRSLNTQTQGTIKNIKIAVESPFKNEEKKESLESRPPSLATLNEPLKNIPSYSQNNRSYDQLNVQSENLIRYSTQKEELNRKASVRSNTPSKGIIKPGSSYTNKVYQSSSMSQQSHQKSVKFNLSQQHYQQEKIKNAQLQQRFYN